MTRARFGRRRNDRRTVRKRADSWLLRRLRRQRTEAAKIGGVTLQVVRDWVMKFNADGPEGLIDRKALGQPPRLNDAHRAALAAILESAPIPAVHGVVRWRIVDLCQWVLAQPCRAEPRALHGSAVGAGICCRLQIPSRFGLPPVVN